MIAAFASVLPALVMGLAGGAHCITMCGGVAGTACGTAEAGLGRRLGHATAFNAGRVASYAVFGAAFGALGSLPLTVVPVEAARIGLRAAAAVLLLGVGLHLAGVSALFARVERIGVPLWSRIAPLARRFLPIRNPAQAAMLGALWAFVPCGLVYGALSLAVSAGSATGGALTMLAFGAGTLPVMTVTATVLASALRRLSTGWPRRVAGLAVAALALQQLGIVAEESAFADSLSLDGLPRQHACCHHGKKEH